MDTNNDGGPAFPGAFARLNSYNEVVERSFQNGMTLRDYFAAKAPPYPEMWFSDHCRNSGFIGEAHTIAAWAYHYADAMLAMRSAS